GKGERGEGGGGDQEAGDDQDANDRGDSAHCPFSLSQRQQRQDRQQQEDAVGDDHRADDLLAPLEVLQELEQEQEVPLRTGRVVGRRVGGSVEVGALTVAARVRPAVVGRYLVGLPVVDLVAVAVNHQADHHGEDDQADEQVAKRLIGPEPAVVLRSLTLPARLGRRDAVPAKHDDVNDEEQDQQARQ